jgi:hypothetical protein
LEDVDAPNPFDRGAVRTLMQILSIPAGSLRGDIRGVSLIDVHQHGTGMVTSEAGGVGKAQNQIAPGPKPIRCDRTPKAALADLKLFESVIVWRSASSPAARAFS